MQIVINVPDETYEVIKENKPVTIAIDAFELIKNGKELPKGHDIIDGTELNKYLDDLIYAEQKIKFDGYETRTDIVERIKIKAEFLTIIEADKEDK